MHTAKLDWITPDAEKVVARHARVSTVDPDRTEYDRLLGYCIKHGHWSVLEQAAASFEIITSRAISPQILRHRTFTFQELCLAGNAKITISNGSGGVPQRLPIEELYRKWDKNSFKCRYARSYDESLDRFIEAPILSVYESGEKPVYRFQIGKRSIDCTREHRVLTKERGFVEFGEAYDNDLTIALNGVAAEPLPYQDPKVLADNAWMGSTRFAEEFGIEPVTARKWFRKHGITPYNRRHAPQSAVDAAFSARKNSFMKWARQNVRKDFCEICGHDGSEHRLEMSHIIAHDGDPALCFDENNLQTLCAKCHRMHDIQEQKKRFGWTLGMGAKWGKIKSQTYLGVQMTYDIEMNHPTHNFVADGIVVHNSQRYANPFDVVGDLKDQPAEFSIRRQAEKNRQSSVEEMDSATIYGFRDRLYRIDAQLYELYNDMLEAGVARECARNILPLYTPTKLHMQGTLRSWIHYVGLRGKEDTQFEHQKIARQIGTILALELPTITKSVIRSEDPSLQGWNYLHQGD